VIVRHKPTTVSSRILWLALSRQYALANSTEKGRCKKPNIKVLERLLGLQKAQWMLYL